MKILILLSMLAFSVPTHPASKFGMPTHPDRVAFGMPTHPGQVV